MRYLIVILLIISFSANSQSTKGTYHDLLQATAVVPPPTTKNFTVDTIPVSAVDLLAPQRGANTFFTNTQWANIPIANTSQWSLDNYYRFYWSLMNTASGVYNWTDFDQQVQQSIARRQRFEFRVTTLDTDIPNAYPVPTAGGAKLVYPTFVHTQMQAEAVKDWTYNNGSQTCWIPNWNSTSYLNAWQTFCVALNNHIMSTSFNGIPFSNVISKIDIAGYGNYSEWHSFPFINNYPSNAQKATQATLQQIVQIHLNAYPMWPAMGNINMWVGECGAIPAFGYFVFFATNLWGRVGILNDHFGWTTTYNNDVPNNTRNFNGVVFGQQIQIQYQVAPIAGEPMNDAAAVTNGGSCAFWHMLTEVQVYHASQFNNQNGTGSGTNANCVGDNYRASSKACGYRIHVENGTVTTNMASGSPMQITLAWSNIGLAPNYENWTVQISLVNAANTTVFTGNSGKVIKFFQPSNNQNTTDNFSLPALAAGTYSVRLKVIDPTGYRNPLPLYNTNIAADGSYLLTTITIV